MAGLLNYRKRGSAIALAAALIAFVVVVALAILAIILQMRVARQTQTAADAAVLTVAGEAARVAVDLKGSAERFFFTDVANAQGDADLLTINRILGKAVLVAANGEEAGPVGKKIAKEFVDQSQDVANRLAREINRKDTLRRFFSQGVKGNPVIVDGKTVDVIPGDRFQSSLIDRGVESNIRVAPGLVPGSVPLTRDKDGNQYIKGYTPFRVGGNDFLLVPAELNSSAHLVDGGLFDANTQERNPLGPAVPVPNAFSVEAVADAGEKSQRSVAFAKIPSASVADLSIPGGFLLIEFDLQVATFGNLLFSGPAPIVNMVVPAFPTPLPVVTLPAAAGSALIVDAVIGEELAGTMFDALFPSSLDSSGESEALDLLTERVRQIDATFTRDQLKRLLQKTPFSPVTVIFKDDNDKIAMADPARAAVVAADKTLALRLPLAKAESNVIPPLSAIAQAGAPRPGTPGRTSRLQCVGSGCTCQSLPGTTLLGTLTFTPGTGATGFLGELRVKRVTNVLVSAVCTVI